MKVLSFSFNTWINNTAYFMKLYKHKFWVKVKRTLFKKLYNAKYYEQQNYILIWTKVKDSVYEKKITALNCIPTKLTDPDAIHMIAVIVEKEEVCRQLISSK